MERKDIDEKKIVKAYASKSSKIVSCCKTKNTTQGLKNAPEVQQIICGTILSQWNKWVATTVIVDFTTHGESHFYGLPCPSADSLDPMDHFYYL